MSEPLGNNEIESVVSSVRRLVSPDTRPRPVSRDLGAERLLLTSSLRIVAEQSESGSTFLKLEAVPKKSRRNGRAKATAKLETPETAGPAAAARPGLAELALTAEDAELINDTFPEVGLASDLALQDLGTEAVEAVAEVAEAVVPEAPGEDVADPPALAAEPAAGVAPDAASLPQSEPDAEDEAEDLDGDDAMGSQLLTDRNGNPISLLDEDDLIALLRTIIQEELQGALGERITRNVRKLVRAEISRALAAQTLE